MTFLNVIKVSDYFDDSEEFYGWYEYENKVN